MTEKRFKLHIIWLNNDYEEGDAELKDTGQPLALFDSVADARIVRDLLNELNDENIELHIQNDFLKVENQHMRDLIIENKQLKQEIKGLRLSVLDSIHEAEEIQCCCTPCVVEECVKKVIE